MLQGPRLPSHATNCTGCGCVQWTLRVDGDRLESTVLMSPPAIHAKYVLTRTGPPAKPGHLALWARTQWRNGCAIGGNETIPNFPWVLPPPTPPPPPPTTGGQVATQAGPCPFGGSVATSTARRRMLETAAVAPGAAPHWLTGLPSANPTMPADSGGGSAAPLARSPAA